MRGSILCAACIAVMPRPAVAQLFDSDAADFLFSWDAVEHEVVADRPLLRHDGPYVVVHLAENRVFVFEGARSLWSAPAGTGTGFRLDTEQHQWRFSTPRGLFHIRRMEKDPLWEVPDWHYVERGLIPPPRNHPSRTMAGIMGTTAIYLGDGIAIHGPNYPPLLMNPDPDARRVSYGCIRLTNEYARELMHIVEVGTPVLIY